MPPMGSVPRRWLAVLALALSIATTACVGSPQPEPPTQRPDDAGAGVHLDGGAPGRDAGPGPILDAGAGVDGGDATGDAGPRPGPWVPPAPRIPPDLPRPEPPPPEVPPSVLGGAADGGA